MSNPTMSAGGWVITYGQNGAIRQAAFGARQARLFKGPQSEFFFTQASQRLAYAARDAIEDLEGELGPCQYAAQLGLPVTKPPEPESPPQPSGSVEAAMNELERLREGGLVSAEEYTAKRREILSRL